MAATINLTRQIIDDNLQIDFSVGISEICDSEINLPNAYMQAIEALGQKTYLGYNLTIFYDEISNKANEFSPIEFEKRLVSYINSCDKHSTMNVINNLFDHMSFLNLSYSDIYSECISILIQFRNCLLEHNLALNDLFSNKYFTLAYYENKNYNDIKEMIMNLAIQTIDCIIKKPVSPTKSLVEKVKNYITENFQSVSRADISAKFYVNPSYLSQIFRQIEGETLTDYIVKIRLEKAKKLLLDSDFTIQEIATQIGYASAQHFGKMFKRYEGKSPDEYRKRIGIN